MIICTTVSTSLTAKNVQENVEYFNLFLVKIETGILVFAIIVIN